MKRRKKPSSTDLLPHFTGYLGLNLQRRISERLLEDGTPVPISAESWAHREAVGALHNREARDRWKFAGDIVSRIYRTQYREAKQTLSFAECVIAEMWELQRRQRQPDVLLEKPADDTRICQSTGLVIPFGPKEYAHGTA